ncbi:MAG: AAA family ATPase [Pseudomonadota bacterium]
MIALITGMSGTGKSTIIAELTRLGLRALDLDEDGWSHWSPCNGNPTGAKPGYDWLWDEEKVIRLLDNSRERDLFLAGCAPNMGRFRARFDQVILLSAPVDVILDRVSKRKTNPYGKTPEEARSIAANLAEIEPLLRKVATEEIDATQPLDAVVRSILTCPALRCRRGGLEDRVARMYRVETLTASPHRADQSI